MVHVTYLCDDKKKRTEATTIFTPVIVIGGIDANTVVNLYIVIKDDGIGKWTEFNFSSFSCC